MSPSGRRTLGSQTLGRKTLGRRTFLQAGAGIVLSGTAGAPWASAVSPASTKVYVLVVDGCRPDELPMMANVSALRDAGMHFPNARSVPVMETIPNHCMMMTGVRPDRSGVPANSIYDRAADVVRDLDQSTDLTFPTLLERLRSTGRTTATVLSKQYLYGVFGTRATYRWEPSPVLPVTGHAPDQATMDALLAMVRDADPDLVFCNLGDVDRVGHADLTGLTLAAARTAALLDTDYQVGRFMTMLKDTGRWSSSVVIVLADHSMDWSYPWALVSLTATLDADPLLAGGVRIAQNGGADLLYFTGSDLERPAAVTRIKTLVAAQPGVLSVHTPDELRLGRRAGDVVAFCRQGWRFSDPQVYSNPIPGNHGHPATEPIPFLISGGSPLVARGLTSSLAVHTIDVAPTIGTVFGLPDPKGGYDGRSVLT